MTSTEFGTTAAHLEALERELLEPMTRAAPDRLDELLSDEFTEYAAAGVALGKGDIVSGLLAEAGDAPVRKASQLEVSLLSETVALITYKVEQRLPGEAPRRSLRSSIWCLKGDRWQMRFHQGTRAA